VGLYWVLVVALVLEVVAVVAMVAVTHVNSSSSLPWLPSPKEVKSAHPSRDGGLGEGEWVSGAEVEISV
jgi:hypothetical protein